MKNLKLVTLSIILLSQVSLVSAMKQTYSEKQFIEWQKKDLTRRINEVINTPTVLNNIIAEYCGANIHINYQLLNDRLLKAIEKEDFKLMQEVFVQGAYVNFTNQNGQTPLICAILNLSHRLDSEFGLYRFIKFLIQQGANINQPDFEGNTPLIYAVEFDVRDTVRFLRLFINKETNLNLQNKYGLTALIKAAKFGNSDLILNLIELGADVNVIDTYGKTAFDYYYKKNDKKIISLLMPESEKKRLEELEKTDLDSALRQIFEVEEKERKEKESKELSLSQSKQEQEKILEFYKNELQKTELRKKEEENDRLFYEEIAEEALAQLEAQSGQEENWDEEQQEEVADDWGELEQED